MDQFYPASLPDEVFNPMYYVTRFGYSHAQAEEAAAQMRSERYYLNSTYQVHVSQPHMLPIGPVIHLSIKRIDRQPIRDWRDMQTIKNMLVGPENEGMEIYPAESRLVDCANQYHSWVLADPSAMIPIPTNLFMGGVMAKTGPKRKPVAERLWAKVNLEVPEGACWEFSGASNGRGYGVLSRPGDSTGVPAYYAHRLAYALANGVDYDDLPPDMEVMHSCDNRKCCNPAHLSLGSSFDNKQDAILKGRMFWQKAKRDATGKFQSRESPDDSEGE